MEVAPIVLVSGIASIALFVSYGIYVSWRRQQSGLRYAGKAEAFRAQREATYGLASMSVGDTGEIISAPRRKYDGVEYLSTDSRVEPTIGPRSADVAQLSSTVAEGAIQGPVLNGVSYNGTAIESVGIELGDIAEPEHSEESESDAQLDLPDLADINEHNRPHRRGRHERPADADTLETRPDHDSGWLIFFASTPGNVISISGEHIRQLMDEHRLLFSDGLYKCYDRETRSHLFSVDNLLREGFGDGEIDDLETCGIAIGFDMSTCTNPELAYNSMVEFADAASDYFGVDLTDQSGNSVCRQSVEHQRNLFQQMKLQELSFEAQNVA